MMLSRWLLLAAGIVLLAGCGDAVETSEMPTQIASGKLPATTLLVSGAKLSGANGLLFGPDGLLYVASVVGSEIVALDPDTGAIKKRLTRADGIDGPDDIAFAPDGTLYWTSILSGVVSGRRPDGTLVTAATLSPGVNPLTFSPNGRLFVAQCFFGDKLYEIDPNGSAPPRLISDQLGPGCGLNGMAWGPEGDLYFAMGDHLRLCFKMPHKFRVIGLLGPDHFNGYIPLEHCLMGAIDSPKPAFPKLLE